MKSIFVASDEDYLAMARECLALAEPMHGPGKTKLLEMAAAWFKRAENDKPRRSSYRICASGSRQESIMALTNPDEARPVHSCRFQSAEGKPSAVVLELVSGEGKQETVHRFLATRETLERLAEKILEYAKTMPHASAGLA